ncbi:unnamed protein product, partial [Iphiclides podalirius]
MRGPLWRVAIATLATWLIRHWLKGVSKMSKRDLSRIAALCSIVVYYTPLKDVSRIVLCCSSRCAEPFERLKQLDKDRSTKRLP